MNYIKIIVITLSIYLPINLLSQKEIKMKIIDDMFLLNTIHNKTLIDSSSYKIIDENLVKIHSIDTLNNRFFVVNISFNLSFRTFSLSSTDVFSYLIYKEGKDNFKKVDGFSVTEVLEIESGELKRIVSFNKKYKYLYKKINRGKVIKINELNSSVLLKLKEREYNYICTKSIVFLQFDFKI